MPTLEELEGEVWDNCDFGSSLIRACHQLRKKPIDEFTPEDLRIMIGQNIGLRFLIPKAIVVLNDDPLVEGDFYPGDLLKNVITTDPTFYDRSPAILAVVIGVVRIAIHHLRLSNADADLRNELQRFVEKYAN